MINLLSEKLFRIYDENNIYDNSNFDCLFFFNELYKKIKENSDDENLKKMINIILIHQSKCNNIVCKCKYIHIFPYGKKYSKNYVNHFLEGINLLFESIFVELDYQKNYKLTFLLAEHYCNFKENPILSYSMVQTILYFYTKSLNINQIFILLIAFTKYIAKCNDKYKIILENKNIEEETFINKQQVLFKKIFENHKYLVKIKNILKKYASYCIQLIKFKENFEESIQFKKNNNNEIEKITSYFLTTKNINKIMDVLLDVFKLNINLINYIKVLDANKVSIDIVYKLTLFTDLFLCRNCSDEMVAFLNSLDSEHNIYSQKLDPNILYTLELLYIDKSMRADSEYFAIFKFCDGITVHYINETLSNILGCPQKALLKAPIENTLPKELSIPHTLAVNRDLILDKNRYVNTDSFLFDKDMQMYPMYADGVSITGLGKNFFCILRSILTDKENVFYFYLGKNFDCISLSHNFNNYNISLNILNKYKMNILELFDFKLEELEVLNPQVMRINKFKENTDTITDYFFAERLFKEKSKYNSNHNNFRLLTLMKKNEKMYNDDNIEINNNKDIDDEERINLIEKMANAINEFDYIKNKLLKRRRKKKKNRKIFVEKLEELMNKYNNENEKSFQKIISFPSKINNAFGNIKEKGKKEMDYGYFNIEFGLTIMYNTYYYIFKIEEICKELPLINQNKKKSILGNNISIISIYEKYNKERSFEQILNKEVNKNFENKKEIEHYNFKVNKVQCFNLFAPLVLFLLGILLIIYIIILFYQRYMFSSGYNSFLVFYYNIYQRDQLYSLYSVLLSSYFHYLNITDFSDIMEENDYIDLIERYSIEFQNSFHKFYDIYIKNKEQDINNIIFEELEVYRISNYYNQTSIIDNYIKHSEYIGYISRLISIEDKIENIIEDSKLLFLGIIFNNENGSKTPTKTYYIQTLYYLGINYEPLFNKIYTNLETESASDFNELAKKSRITYLIFEILGFIIIIIFYIISLIFLFQTNIAIFRNIINMFISDDSQDNFHYKNKKENYLLIKIINSFISLVNDFNLDNLHKFQFILNQSSNQISINSTLNVGDDINSVTYSLNEENKSNNKININKNNSKNKFENEIINHIIDNKSNNSEFNKLNLSSSKVSLKSNNSISGDIVKNLNNPQLILENNNSISEKKSFKSNKYTTNKSLIKNNNSFKDKSSKPTSKKRSLAINQVEEPKKKKDDNLNDEEKMTTEMFLNK